MLVSDTNPQKCWVDERGTPYYQPFWYCFKAEMGPSTSYVIGGWRWEWLGYEGLKTSHGCGPGRGGIKHTKLVLFVAILAQVF